MSDSMLKRTPHSESILLRLRDRETHSSSSYRARRSVRLAPGAQFNTAREFYLNITPNLTIVRVEKLPPACCLRKFSPDGMWMLAFTAQQSNEVQIHEYRGVQTAGNLLARAMPNGLPPNSLCVDHPAASTLDGELRQKIFDTLFLLRHSIPIAHFSSANEQLCREFSLFSSTGSHVICASSMPISSDRLPPMHEVWRNNEGLTPTLTSVLEDYSFYSIEIRTGKMCDVMRLRADRIALAHSSGVALCGSTMVVLSLQHQTLYVYRFDEDGRFVPMSKVGRFLAEEDALAFVDVPIYADPMMNALKQRMLAFLYRKAAERARLERFYRAFEFLRALRMWRMQLLDERTVLVRFAIEEVVAGMADDPHAVTSVFVVYDLLSTEVIAMFDSSDDTLVELYERHADDFRAPVSAPNAFPCSVSSSLHARANFERYMEAILHSKFGGAAKATKQILSQLPFSAQSFSACPYLDLELFSYDEKHISSFERPKLGSENAVRFYARKSHRFKFQLHCGPATRAAVGEKSYVAFIVHPFDPFVISVQRMSRDAYVVNFHLRYAPS